MVRWKYRIFQPRFALVSQQKKISVVSDFVIADIRWVRGNPGFDRDCFAVALKIATAPWHCYICTFDRFRRQATGKHQWRERLLLDHFCKTFSATLYFDFNLYQTLSDRIKKKL